MNTVPERIAQGVELLDDHFDGREWISHISLTDFDMGSPYQCILGQLFGVYSKGKQVLGIGWRATELGFNAYDGELYASLTLVWRDWIMQEREKQ